MNRLIKKIACVVMALTVITGIFTGCTSSDTKFFLDNRISLKEQYGSLPDSGTVGDIQYRILEQNSFSLYESKAGYYVDTLDQPNSPYYIVITSGPTKYEKAEISIVDLGMDGTTLHILVRETDGTGGPSGSTFSPTCALELDHMPENIQINGENGKVFNLIEG